MPRTDGLSSRYELGFGIFVGVLVFLGRGDPSLDYPQVLYLFLLLLAVNLAAGVALRLKPSVPGIAAGFVLANCGTITSILAHSGGPDSKLWVLFLLPILTGCLLLGAREAAFVTAGVAAVNAVYTLLDRNEAPAVLAFELALKSGCFLFTGLLAWRLTTKERDTRRRLDAESRRAEQLAGRLEASSALSEVGLVGAGVAHDLKNVFMVISGFAEAIAEQGGLPPEARDGFERIQRMAQVGGRMARQLSQHGAGVPIELVSDDLSAVAADVAALVKGSFAEKGVELAVEGGGGPCPILASRVHLQRVFLNLLLNALSVSAPGGRVRLWVRREGAQALAGVEDDGPGLPEELLPRLFEPFETTRVDAGGTGLGLNLSARIAREHRGGLSAENRSEGGARFLLRLPLGCAATAPLGLPRGAD
ncbi:MAG: HAMP domain-containing histidine kinase [Elusimicrobia bacterium]|nr:HAMP domain-containing histidine kinase [Elusimicrobiota bacterium]